MDVGAAQILEDPSSHGGIAAVVLVVEHGRDAVAEAGIAEGGGKLLRLSEAPVGALQLLEGDVDRPPQVAHQVAHGRPGVDDEVSGTADVVSDPVRGYERDHQPTISKSVSTVVGWVTDWVTGEPSTARRQMPRRVSSSASART